jgi:hypothetical protein
MNSVTASATLDVGQFLADNVGVAPTRADMSPTFPTKTIGLQGHQNVVTIGRQRHTKVPKGSHMSQKMPKSSLVVSLARQKLPRGKVACLAVIED